MALLASQLAARWAAGGHLARALCSFAPVGSAGVGLPTGASIGAGIAAAPGPLAETGISAEEALLSRLCRPPVRCLVARPTRRGADVAAALRFEEHGPPQEVLSIGEAPLPPLGPADALVDFLAAPINPADLNIVEGKYPLKPPLPATPGNEGVAVVREVGREVDPERLKPGDRVVPLEAGLGTWRASAVLPAECLYRVPPSIPTLTAATLTINPPTALCLLERFVELNPGCTIVQNGANSAVGQAVIELAAWKKVNTINVIRERDDWNEISAHLRRIGATVVTTLERALSDSAHLSKPVLALNCVGGSSATKLAKMLCHGGTIVTYGGMSLEPVTIPTPLLIFKDIRARGFALSINCSREDKAALLDQIMPLAQKGMFGSQRFESFGFDDFQEALQRATQPYRSAKVMLELPAYDG